MDIFTAAECEAIIGRELRGIRSRLHSRPELSLHEYETTLFIRGVLNDLGIEVLDIGLKTGCIGIIRARSENRCCRTVMLRADIDALPIGEATDAPDKSAIGGVMHACGHDIHATGLIGAAMLLAKQRDMLPGDIALMFQPAEENVCGAWQVINSGLFNMLDIGAVLGLHVWPELPLGSVGLRAGSVLSAKDSFKISIIGRGGHGSAPHRTIDPIPAGAALISGIQSLINRELDPMESAVISICSVHAGNSDNIIPDTLSIEGSMRTFQAIVRLRLIERLKSMAGGTADAFGCTSDFSMDAHKAVPSVVNDALLHELATEAVKRIMGSDSAVDQPQIMISEDFARYGVFAPSYFYLLGVGENAASAQELHCSSFYPSWRSACYAAALLAGSAIMCFDCRNAL